MSIRTAPKVRDEAGFTLIELLVVVVIIAILTAIALPAFMSQRLKSWDAAAKSDVRNMVTQVETCYQENGGYTGCDALLATGTGLEIGPGPGQVQITRADAAGYEIVGTSRSYDSSVYHSFKVTRDASAGDLIRDCAIRGRGGCPADGDW